MKKYMKFLSTVRFCAFLLLCGCSPYRLPATQGQVLDASCIQAIHPHSTTRHQVLATLGSPVLESDASRAQYIFATIDKNRVFTLITSFTIFFDNRDKVSAITSQVHGS